LLWESDLKSNLFIAQYFQYQACLNIEQGINLWHLLNQVLLLDIPGDVVELGSLTGMTAAVIERTLMDFGSEKRLYLFDSHEGLPQIQPQDGKCPLKPENFKTSPDHTVQRFTDLGLRQPVIVPGWFADTLPHRLPAQICFAHVDGDLYSSVKESLEAIYPRLSSGAVVLVDDYAESVLCKSIAAAYNDNPYSRGLGRTYTLSNWLPGVRKACDEFLANKPEEMTVLIAGEERHGFFRKID
jgi:O-methyltransferase